MLSRGGQNAVQWAHSTGLRNEVVARIMTDHPNVLVETCPDNDPLWTADAKTNWSGERTKRRAFVTAKEKIARNHDDEEEEEAPAKKQKKEKEPPHEFLCPITN